MQIYLVVQIQFIDQFLLETHLQMLLEFTTNQDLKLKTAFFIVIQLEVVKEEQSVLIITTI